MFGAVMHFVMFPIPMMPGGGIIEMGLDFISQYL
jgi:hypothetical protein